MAKVPNGKGDDGGIGRRRTTVPEVRAAKGVDVLVMVTAYDTPTARLADEAGVDVILVGDSLGEVVLGYQDTLHVTVDDMVRHVAAVARARPSALVVADMPWLSYHLSTADTVANAGALVRAGAAAVKIEGGQRRLGAVRALVEAEIPVMGHLGLTPQSVNVTGGYRVQAQQPEPARRLLADAALLEEAGLFALVLECVPRELAHRVTQALAIPTIGIGAGPDCDGQVLVFHDVVGLGDRIAPRFVRRYADLRSAAVAALTAYGDDVRGRRFPSDGESYHLAAGMEAELDRPDSPEGGAGSAGDGAVADDGLEGRSA